jgi:hypothetical protein
LTSALLNPALDRSRASLRSARRVCPRSAAGRAARCISPELSRLESSRDVQLERAQHLVHELLNRSHETVCVPHGVPTVVVRQLPPVADPAGHSIGEAQHKLAIAYSGLDASSLRRLHVEVQLR